MKYIYSITTLSYDGWRLGWLAQMGCCVHITSFGSSVTTPCSPHLSLLLLRLLAQLEQSSMERKSSLAVQLQRNEKLVKLVIISLLGVLIICYCLQVVMFLIPIIYPGYNTVKTIQVLIFLLSPLPENVTLFRQTQ